MKKRSIANNIITALPSLTLNEKIRVLDALRLLMGEHNLSVPLPETYQQEMLYAIILNALKIHLPWDKFIETSYFKMFLVTSEAVGKFIEDTWPEAKNSKLITLSLMKLLTGLAIDNAKTGSHRSLYLSTILAKLRFCGLLFDDAYPNYREAGLANIVLKAMKSDAAKAEP